jgi:hypothetical protein
MGSGTAIRRKRVVTKLGLFIAAWVGAAFVAAFAQQPTAGAVAKVARMTAKVEALDRTARTLTLRGPKGAPTTIAAGRDVRGFDPTRVGDFVVVRYLEPALVDITKSGSSMGERVEAGTDSAARRVTVVAEVVAKDARKRTVTLRGPRQTVELRAPRAEQLKLVAPGDRVEATYIEAAAISIELAVSRPGDAKK